MEVAELRYRKGMTEVERDHAVGKLRRALSAAKQEHAAVLMVLREHRDRFEEMRDLCDGCLRDYAVRTTVHEVPKELPTADRLARLLDELRTTAATVAECEGLLREYGL